VSDGLRGRRDSRSDTWQWPPVAEPPRRRPPWRPILAVIVGLGLFGAGLGLLLVPAVGDENDRPVPSPTPSRARTATPVATREPSPEPTPTATAAADADITVRLLAWSRQQSRWLPDRLEGGASGYREGEPVPFLARLDGTVDGASYEIALRYQCGTDKGAALDYVAEPAEADVGSILTEPGPGRPRADSTIPAPDDPSIAFDDGVRRRFQVWGATFQQTPAGPSPTEPCTDAKQLRVSVTAHDSAVFLIWAGHLASAADWGEGRGASSQGVGLFSEASVDGGAQARLEIAPDAVAP